MPAAVAVYRDSNDPLALELSGKTVSQSLPDFGVGLVYSKDNYHNDWYGQTNNGERLPDATYYYVIETLSSEIKTGWVYINSEQ